MFDFWKEFFDYFRVDFLVALDSFKAVLTQPSFRRLKRLKRLKRLQRLKRLKRFKGVNLFLFFWSKLVGFWIIGQKSTFSINIILCILGIDVDIMMGPKYSAKI